jgi:uncharacterized LabA/DUF88 family protein
MRYFLGIISLLFPLIFITTCGKSPKVIAKVEDQKITVQELEEYLQRNKNVKDISTVSYEEKRQALQDLIDNETKIVRAEQLGLDKKPEFVADIQQQIDRMSAQKLSQMEIIDKFVPAKLTKAFYEIDARKIKIAAIALGYSSVKEMNVQRNKKETIELAKKLMDDIKSGQSIVELSQKYSEGTIIKRSKGVIDQYRPGLFDPLVDLKIATAQKDNLLGPIVTDRGVFIIKILEDEPLSTAGNYAEAENRIKWQIFSQFYRAAGDSLHKKLSLQYKDELGGTLSKEGIDSFLPRIDTLSRNRDFKDSDFTEQDRSILLGRIGSINITVGYLLDQFRGNFYRSVPQFNSEQKLEQNLNAFMDNYLSWVLMARKKGIDKDLEIVAQIEKIKRSKLSQLFDQYEINPNIEPTEEEIEDYYRSNPEQFTEPAKIKIWEIALKSEKEAEEVYHEALKKNANFEDLAAKYTEKRTMKNHKGDIGYQSEKSSREIVKEAFKAGPNKIIGPIPERNLYYVIKTGDLQPSHVKPFNEVKLVAKGNAQREKANRIKQSLLAQLQQQYDVWINETLLKKLS